ncbi:MAG: DUF6282 family protein, partial [Nanoarchaeota archaeon]
KIFVLYINTETEIIKNAVDLHVHIGPEIIPRKFTLPDLVEYEKGKIKTIAVKNHFFPTVFSGNLISSEKPSITHSVALNLSNGGFNSEIIKASCELANAPIIVWFPTIHAQNFLEKSDYEIAPEWFEDKNFKARKSNLIKGLNVFDESGNLKPEVINVLKVIKETDSILATGHISWKESKSLVEFATKKLKLKKIIITHPIYQKIDMPLEIQKELANLGAFIEVPFSMYSIDKIPIEKLIEHIKTVSSKNVILSSDVGQTFSKSPSEALEEFIDLLSEQGISEKEIDVMLVKNPNCLVSSL